MDFIIILVIGIIITAAILWVSAKIAGINLTFPETLVVAVIANLFGIIPVLGPILGLIGFFVALKQITQADTWPDLVLLVIITWGLSALIVITLLSKAATAG